MKELFYKDILGDNPRKREVSMEETYNRTDISGGLRKKTKFTKRWVAKYFIKEEFKSLNVSKLRSWVNKKKEEGCRRDCHILRRIDARTGENRIVCKVLGEFFVIWAGTAYKIVYVNEIRIQDEGRNAKKARW